MNCNKCGFENKADAVFCKNCGVNLKDTDFLINRLNNKINILGVSVGLIVSILVLFICTILFSLIITLKIAPFQVYILLVIMAMTFFGSIFSGALTSKTIEEGSINGCFLSLIVLIFAGLMLGILFLGAFGVSLAISSAFQSTASYLGSGTTSSALSTLNSTYSSTSNDVFNSILYLVEFIAGLVFILISGTLGGALGVYIRKALKGY